MGEASKQGTEALELAKELMRDAAERAEIVDPFSCDIFTADDWLRDWAERIGRVIAAKQAEIERWKREAMAARLHLNVEKVPDGAFDVFPPGARYVVIGKHFKKQPSTIRDDANEYGTARAANGTTP